MTGMRKLKGDRKRLEIAAGEIIRLFVPKGFISCAVKGLTSAVA